jgi:ubiquinone/menaquinone biosynthesis C-methylase UbiE
MPATSVNLDSVERQFDHQYADFTSSPRGLERIAWTLSHVPPDAQQVLEVGAGTGRISNALRARGKSVVAVDLSLNGLKACRTHRVKASGTELPFGAGAYDVTICAEVIEHLAPDIRKATLRELDRVSRRYVLITVPNAEVLQEMQVRCDRCGSTFHVDGHVASFTETSLAALYPYRAKILTSGHRVRAWAPLLLDIRQKALGCYAWDTPLTCPTCLNNDVKEPRRTLAVKVLDRLNYYLGREREAGWLLALFDKQASVSGTTR